MLPGPPLARGLAPHLERDLRARRLELTRAALHESLLGDSLEQYRVVVDTLTDDFDVVGKHIGNAQTKYGDAERRLTKFEARLEQAVGGQARAQPSADVDPGLLGTGGQPLARGLGVVADADHPLALDQAQLGRADRLHAQEARALGGQRREVAVVAGHVRRRGALPVLISGRQVEMLHQRYAPRYTAYGAPGPAGTVGHFYIATTNGLLFIDLETTGLAGGAGVLRRRHGRPPGAQQDQAPARHRGQDHLAVRRKAGDPRPQRRQVAGHGAHRPAG